jgi:tetratricopeptide (TPR) repeat protein
VATLDELARAGIAAINENRLDDAIAALTQALALEPDRPDMNNALGTAYLRRGEPGTALPFLEKSVVLAEGSPGAHLDDLRRHFQIALASGYQLADRVTEARRTLEAIVRRWPAEVEARIQLGNLLLSTGGLTEAVRVLRDAAEHLEPEPRQAAEALYGAVESFLESDADAMVFFQGHQESYVAYFDEIAGEQEKSGWIAEAARMARGPDGEPRPILANGAKSYAMQRVDLVDPASGQVSSVYSEKEPMVVAVEGLEPLAQVAVLFPTRGYPFDVLVSTQVPWHWLRIAVQFERGGSAANEALDQAVGDWYLAGFNGEFGDRDRGRFHYVGDPDPLGDRAVGYVVDLGRASLDAIGALLRRLTVLHDTHAIRRVVFGYGRLPDL